jgi:ribosomal protein S18 acetylase RimI-like enzyme
MEMERIGLGFDESERMRVGTLYWEAFQRKLRPAFADPETGLRVVQASMRSERVLVSRSDAGSVSGVCGFHEERTGAVAMTWTTMRGILSVGQALRATLVLSLLARDDEAGALVLDGICVDREQRGSGIGTALLDAAEAYARARGLASVCLSVVDGNPRARALYTRRGFVPVSSGALGVLGVMYGFDGYTVMRKALVS